MTIREIVSKVATFIGWHELKAYVDENGGIFGECVEKAEKTLVELTNVVVNELACSYIPAITVEDVSVAGGRVWYKNLKKKPLKILKVRDSRGKELAFSSLPEYIMVDGETVSIEYEYSPDKAEMDDELCYMEKDVPARVIAYGVTAEYCIVDGDFDQAVMWHKRYTDAIADICLPKNVTARRRSWV
jgi:hypothetical protein